MQLILRLLVALVLALLLHFFTRPEEAGYILTRRFNNGVRFEHLQLAEELVRQQGTEIGEWQVHRRCILIYAGNRRSKAAARLRLWVPHVAHIDLALTLLATALGDGAMVGDKLLLVHAFGLT